MSSDRQPTKPALLLFGAAAAVVRVIVTQPAIVLIWALFSLMMALVRSLAMFELAAGSPARFKIMEDWSPLFDLTGDKLPGVAARLVLPLLMLLSVAFYQATLNRAAALPAPRLADPSAIVSRELRRFASCALVYVAIAAVTVLFGPVWDLAWTAAKAPALDGIGQLVGFVTGLVLLARLSLVSQVAYQTGALGFAQSWRLTRGYSRVIMAIIVLCSVVSFLQTLVVGAAHYELFSVLNGGRTLAPIRPRISSLGAFVLSPGLGWSMVNAVLATLAWPIILAPFPALYQGLAGPVQAGPGVTTSTDEPGLQRRRRPSPVAIGAAIVLIPIALGICWLVVGWWDSNRGEWSRGFACSDFNQPSKAAAAIRACDAALRSVPGGDDEGRALTLYMRGGDYRDLGDFKHALADLQESDRLRPNDFHTLEDLGDLHERAGDHDAAVSDYQRLFAVMPSAVAVIEAKCGAKAREGASLDQARTDCDAVLRFTPSDGHALDMRGIIDLKQSRFADAWRDFDRAVHAEPEDAGHRYGRGLAELALGRSAEGRADLAAATKAYPTVGEDFAADGLTAPR